MKTLYLALLCLIASLPLAAQTQLAADDFSSGTTGAPLGSNWTACGNAGGSLTKLTYEGGSAGGAGYYSVDCAAYTGAGAFPSNQYATATLVTATPSSIAQAAVEIRANATASTADTFIACGWNDHDFSGGDAHYRIWSKDAGGNFLTLATTTVTPATGDVVGCQVLGVSVTLKVNGTLVASATDTSGTTSGYPALSYLDPTPGSPTSSDVIWDNFSAGAGASLVSVTITPTTKSVLYGTFAIFTGTATYADGTTATMNHWTSSNSGVASIDNSGFAYASTAGTVTITGSAGLDSGTATLTVTSTTAYTPLVHDAFTGTIDTYLGSNWTGCGWDGGAYSKLSYENHAAGGSGYASQTCADYTAYGTFPADQYATAVLVAPNPTAAKQGALVVRDSIVAASLENYISCGWNFSDFKDGNGHYRIWSLGPGTASFGGAQLLWTSTTQTPQTGDVLWCQVSGSTITMKVNGTVVARVQDHSGLTGGYPGMYYIDPVTVAAPPTDVVFSQFVAGAGPSVSSIAITPGSPTVTAGSYYQLTAQVTYTDGTSAAAIGATWSSSATGAATVDGNGLALGVAPGSATITGSFGGQTGTAALTVANGSVPASTASRLVTSDPYLNLGTATPDTYNNVSPYSRSPSTPTVPLAANSAVKLWQLEPDPWGLKEGSGSVSVNYTGAGSIVETINVSGLTTDANGIGGVNGSPFVLLGCDAYGGCLATGQPLRFPKRVADMSSLIVDYTYTLAGSISGSVDVDQIFDEYLCPTYQGGGTSISDTNSTGDTCLEVEVLPYFNFTYGTSGTLLKTVSFPMTVNGVSTTMSFDEYNSSDSTQKQQDILFYPHNMPGLAAASLRFDMLPILKQAMTDFGDPQYQWLMGMEMGTEFGATAAPNYSLTFTKLDFEQTLGSANRQPIMYLLQ